jgi:hypothetical protein
MRLVEIVVNRSEHHSVRRFVGAWEIPVIQYEYGPEKVEIHGYKRDGRAYPDPGSEYERFSLRYGIDVENGQTKAALAYGQGAMGVMAIRNLMEAEKKAEAEEGDSLEVLNTVHNVVVDEERIREARAANEEAAKQAQAAQVAQATAESPLVAQLIEQNRLLTALLMQSQQGPLAQPPAPAEASKTLGLPKAKSA